MPGPVRERKNGWLAADVIGYRQDKGSVKDSQTPTFAMIELFIDDWRWRGIQFFQIYGKRLHYKEIRKNIEFKEVSSQHCKDMLGITIHANRLIVETFPCEAIHINFQAKNPGVSICIRSMTMNFSYQYHFHGTSPDA